MAFWGVEVKPGKPYTHCCRNSRGRLHISQATLGIGSAMKKSLVQCNIGNSSPVFLCCLLPDKTESCPLSLEFEESDEVVFSIIGPRSVHLTGYYLGNHPLNDDSEFYGEDIADTETESTRHSGEDTYENSFIDDDDPEVFPLTPVSSGGEVMLDDDKPKKTGRRRRLKKKYQLSESDDDHNSQQPIVANGSRGVPALESEDDDSFPISSLFRRNSTEQNMESSAGKKDEETSKSGEKKPADDLRHVASKRKADVTLPESVGLANDARPNKRKKQKTKEGKSPEANCADHGNVPKDDTACQDEAKTERTCLDLPVGDIKHHNSPIDKHFDINGNQYADEAHCEKIKKKKKKKKKSEEDGFVNVEASLPLMEEKSGTLLETVDRDFNAKSSPCRTLTNGLSIEELEMGEADGRVASQGKKVRVHFIGKLKDNGQIFHSNIGQIPFKFRLGSRKVIEAWNIGLEGMRVGGKRKIIIPPSMGCGSEGDGDKVPPNSWLVYEIELVGVR
ncbi:peptidyl-prolyl cis-trans isomerase FKBP43 isoform X2 [Malania oleifera]|uniref:peptidyl-prolyl cis-trans isomerase FKBP43 isoform X2 n=1 Tax=Malania oleifera TaxID=397392 RepID=UPI0025AE1BAE|nr:peptidyl-prolyl cis-trans isomerase FKBP43 isoform X2 [Malania oleifera]